MALAQDRGGGPAFLLGAMLPDLAAMVDARPVTSRSAPAGNPELLSGIHFHLLTDALFHETKTFIRLNRKMLQAFRRLGVTSGPARACAHVGVEFLLDAALAQETRYEEGYLAALRFGLEQKMDFGFFTPEEAVGLSRICQRLESEGLSLHRLSVERLEFRLRRTFQGRARLLPSGEELKVIVPQLIHGLSEFSALVPQLWQELSPLLQPQAGSNEIG